MRHESSLLVCLFVASLALPVSAQESDLPLPADDPRAIDQELGRTPPRASEAISIGAPEPATLAAPEVVVAAAQHPAIQEDPFELRTQDGRFSLRPHTLFSLRASAQFADDEAAGAGASLAFSRLGIAGKAGFDSLRYMLLLELAGTGPRIFDAELTWHPDEAFYLRLGQYRVQFSRSFLVPIFRIQLVTRSVVSDYFRAGRDTGVSVGGHYFDGLLNLEFGIFNGSGMNAPLEADGDFLTVGRAVVVPWGKVANDETPFVRSKGATQALAIGAGAYNQPVERSDDIVVMGETRAAITRGYRRALGIDLTFFTGPFSAMGEFFFAALDIGAEPTLKQLGGYLQTGLFVYQGCVELAARGSLLQPDLAEDDALLRLELGINGYLLADNVKVQLFYAYTRADGASTSILPRGHEILLQTQAYY